MNIYHVTFFYLATGMEGRAQTKDYGNITATTAEEAKDIALRGTASAGCSFTLSCLTAKLVSGSTSEITGKAKEPILELSPEDEVLTPIEVPDVADILLRRKDARSEKAGILRQLREYTEDLAQINAELDQLDAELDETVSNYI